MSLRKNQFLIWIVCQTKVSSPYTLQVNIENQLRGRTILNIQNLAPSEIEIMYCNYEVDLVFYLEFSHRWNSTDFTWPELLYTYQGQLCIRTQNSFHLIQKSSRSFLLFKKLGKIKYSLENIFFVVPDKIDKIDHIQNYLILEIKTFGLEF